MRNYFVVGLVLVNLLFLLTLLSPKQSFFLSQNLTSKSFTELEDYFSSLANNKGAVVAFNELKKVQLPPNIDTHLLGHAIGDILFKQKGLSGIYDCTQDFRNACSHSIVVGLLLEKGESALDEIADACRKAPGGKGAYTMCFHGLGHGVLAYYEYDFEKTIALCQKTGTKEFFNREAHECIGGAVMELTTGGSHNPKMYQQQLPKYLSASDPLSPCNASFMPESARPMCYIYLTPHLWQLTGMNLGNPTDALIQQAFPYCNKIPANETQNRNSCYGGFGKEFVVLVNNRDVRSFNDLKLLDYRRIYALCFLADNQAGKSACLDHALNALFWGGENDKMISVKFCQSIPSETDRDGCYKSLIGAVNYYIQDPNYKQEFCSIIPQGYNNECQKIL